jgi:predicted O-linked N-acetylglucosamine transferase (SPINDLY family)
VRLSARDPTLHHNVAQALAHVGRLDEAITHYEQAIALQPRYPSALGNLANLLLQQEKFERAADTYLKLLAISPNQPVIENNLGTALQRLNRYDEAFGAFERALAAKPDYLQALVNQAILLSAMKRPEEAATRYAQAAALTPHNPEIYNDLGNALFEAGQLDRALASYDRALALNADYVPALGNRAQALYRLGFHDSALATYDDALSIAPDNAGLLNNRANTLRELSRYQEAALDFERLVTIAPDYPYALGNYFHARVYCCDWRDYQERAEEIIGRVMAGAQAAAPMALINIPSSPEAHLSCARIFSADHYPASSSVMWRGERYRHDRIRVAYLSADFHASAVSQLIVGLFESHDPAKFEITAISLGPDRRDPMRQRLQRSFARFVDMHSRSDREVAALLRELEIDIAVDLNGHTRDARLGIFAHKPAPVQVTFLGFPGTTGTDFFEYVIADNIVVPEDQKKFYTEQVVHLPDTYQPNDRQRPLGQHTPTRREVGLPASGFVFCCFNNAYKITPAMFAVWMRLLQQVEGSVLWLLADTASATKNLQREAEARGINPARLVFAPRVAPADHLARLRLAELQLDTLPYNAHTTASESLWVGLPLITCLGDAFAGRVAASLLRAAGLPELIADNLNDYESLALKLAQEPQLLRAIRSKLEATRMVCPLFDTDRFRRHLESAYVTIWQRHQRGEPPEGFAVPPLPA